VASVTPYRVQSGLIFTTRAGTPFEPRDLNRRFETRCAKRVSGPSRFMTCGIPAPPSDILCQQYDMQDLVKAMPMEYYKLRGNLAAFTRHLKK
jgi:hypothetical protein